MKEIGTRRLETERLVLRQFVLEDLNDVFNNYANDPEVTKFLSWDPHGSLEVTEQFLKETVQKYDDKHYRDWAIVLKEKNQVIGSISVVNANKNKNEVEIGYCISKQHWNDGLMTEALIKVLDFLINDAKVNKVYCCCDTRNIASYKVMEKANMVHLKTMIGESKSSIGIGDKAVYVYDKSRQLFKK